MENTYKINNQDRELLNLLTKLILNNIDKNGTDILLGKMKRSNIDSVAEEKSEFDKMCATNIDAEPELQVSFSKYKLNNKEYYHIGICSSESMEKNNEKIINKNFSKIENVEYVGKTNLTDRQIELIRIIKNNPYIKYEDLKDTLGVSKGTICMDIRLLKKMKVIERVGTNDGRWVVNKKFTNV